MVCRSRRVVRGVLRLDAVRETQWQGEGSLTIEGQVKTMMD